MPDDNLEEYHRDLDRKQFDYQSALQKQHLKGNEDDRQMKQNIFGWVKILINSYLLFVAVIIFFKSFFGESGLTPPEIIAILTSTTATIIGLPYLIVSSLFGKNELNKNQKTTDKNEPTKIISQ